MQTTWAYISNNFIYSAMGVFALSFFAHAFETAWAVKVPSDAYCRLMMIQISYVNFNFS